MKQYTRVASVVWPGDEPSGPGASRATSAALKEAPDTSGSEFPEY